MMNKPFKGGSGLLLVLAVAGAATLTGCVDNDYDLSKDVDLKVTLGGQELHIPVSNTDVLTMGEILDIDPQSSSIQTDKAGNYSLVQSAPGTSSSIDIDRVKLGMLTGDLTATNFEFPLRPGLAESEISTGNIVSNLSIEDSHVNPNLKSLSEAETDVRMSMKISYTSATFSGAAKIKAGLTAAFPPGWTVEPIDDSSSYLTNVDSHTLRFTRDVQFDKNGFTPVVKVSHFKLGKNRGEGLYEVGHFDLDASITFNGKMSIVNSANQSGLEKVVLCTDTRVVKAELLSVTGCVDPQISVNPTSVQISSIPDFLAEQGNNLDLINPQIYLTVHNTSPVSVNVNALLTAYTKTGEKVSVGVGSDHGTAPITIKGNGYTDICLTRTGTPDKNGSIPVKVERLGELLSTVPERIEISNISAKADQTKEVTFVLGSESGYEFSTDYEAVVPFKFGKNLRLTYNETDNGWDTEDFDKYNFSQVNLSATVINSSPLTLNPVVDALDKDGNVIPNVTATISGVIAGGSLEAPSKTPIKVILRSTGKNISNLAGVSVNFEATIDPAHVGECLNENQSVRFDDINASITGGISVDLN